MQIHPPQVRKFLFCLSLDFGTKFIASVYSMLFGLLIVSVTVSVFRGRFDVPHDVFSDTTFVSFGIFSSVLLNGAFRANPVHMLPWVLINLVFLAFIILSIILTCILLAVQYDDSMYTLTVLCTCATGVSYSTVVVYSNYLKIKEGPTAN